MSLLSFTEGDGHECNQAQPATIRPWNKGKFVGQKAPLKLKEIWAIRIRLQLENRTRDLVLFNLAIDSKLRSDDLLGIRVSDVQTLTGHERTVSGAKLG
jgi:hypothetical protein